jgi:hypothetical protein
MDAKGVTWSKQFTIAVASGLTIVTAPTLPSGSVGVAYSQTFFAAGGTPPYAWIVTAGSLGDLTLDPSTGRIHGTPTSSGNLNFTVQVTDSASVTARKQFTLTIASSLTITTPPALSSGAVGSAYSVTLNASGGTPPYTWSIINGALPGGLILNASTGAITGIPRASGPSSFTAQVTDGASATATKLFTISVASSLAITTPGTLPSGALGVPYSLTLGASGGTQPYRWTLSSGALPKNLALSPSGTISHRPPHYHSPIGAYDPKREAGADFDRP